MRPLTALRRYCLWCMNGNSKEVELCSATDCPLYPFRLGKRIKGKSILRAIKERCIDCGEGTISAVKKCEFSECPLYRFRRGHNPSRRGIGRSKEDMSKIRQLSKERKGKIGN